MLQGLATHPCGRRCRGKSQRRNCQQSVWHSVQFAATCCNLQPASYLRICWRFKAEYLAGRCLRLALLRAEQLEVKFAVVSCPMHRAAAVLMLFMMHCPHAQAGLTATSCKQPIADKAIRSVSTASGTRQCICKLPSLAPKLIASIH